MPDNSPRLALPFLLPSQAQKHVIHNEALARLDALVQLTAQALDAETPPAAPAAGQVFGLGADPVGDWAGQGGRLAVWDGVAWGFVTPAEGWRAFDLAAGRLMAFSGGTWAPVAPEPQNLDGVGIGTTSDPVNRLALAAEAALFSHAGGDHRLKVNKAAAGDTASLLFQSGWTGHAEMGLAGDTAFSIKVSADGQSWSEAMRADPGAQAVSWAPAGVVRMVLADAGLQLDVPLTGTAVQSSQTDTTADRLMKVGAFGLGAGTPPTLGDFTAALIPGLYKVFEGSATGHPVGGSFGGVAIADVDANGYPHILTMRSSLNSPRLWHGYRGATTGAVQWNEIFSQRNCLGTVSQSGGVPTGRLIERGSNANGWYVRFADGTQICLNKVLLKADTDTTSGDKSAAWTFPATFVSSATDLAINHTIQGGAPGNRSGVSVSAISNSGCTLWYNETGSFAFNVYTLAVAIGRWF